MKLFRVICFALCGAGAVLVITTCFAQTPPSAQFTPQQVEQIQQIIHNYLVTNPKVLIEASIALQQQQAVAQQQQTTSAIATQKSKIFNFEGMPFAGNSKGSVVMMEFFDYRCPHCQLMIPAIEQLIKSNPNLKVVFAEWPIFGGVSKYAAQIALAANMQGKYYAFHNALLKKAEELAMQQKPLTQDDVLAVAKTTGLDVNKLQSDLKSITVTPKINSMLAATDKIARSIKIIGTPAFIVVNTKTHTFKYLDGQTTADALQKLIDEVK